jgi:hypothetical protein
MYTIGVGEVIGWLNGWKEKQNTRKTLAPRLTLFNDNQRKKSMTEIFADLFAPGVQVVRRTSLSAAPQIATW